MYLQMSNRGDGPPPRKSRRTSAALGAPIDTQEDESQSDHMTLDDSVERKRKALNSASGENSERDQADVHNLEDIPHLTTGDTDRNFSTPANIVSNHQTDNVAGTYIQYVVYNSDTNMHSHTPLYGRQSMSKPLTLGINPKTKGMIWANECVDLGVLLTHNTSGERFKMNETTNSLGYENIPPVPYRFRNMTHRMSAFHIFVSIHCQKYPLEAGNLMKYTSIIRNLAK